MPRLVRTCGQPGTVPFSPFSQSAPFSSSMSITTRLLRPHTTPTFRGCWNSFHHAATISGSLLAFSGQSRQSGCLPAESHSIPAQQVQVPSSFTPWSGMTYQPCWA